MSKVQRYDCELQAQPYFNEEFATMEFNEDGGEWVRYTDYEVMRINHDKQLERAEFFFNKYAEQLKEDENENSS